jgi:RNA polymerase sigma-70 factor, ECF subfamily
MPSITLRIWNGLRSGATLTESALLAHAQRGNREAFDGLVRLHEPMLRRFLSRQNLREGLEDVLQEAFLAAWIALPGFEPRVRFKTWLYRIAMNKAMDAHRRTVDATPLDGLTLPAADVWGRVESALWVHELLAELPDVQRLILELYYFDDLTLEETALVLDRNLNTVKYHFYQAHTRALRLRAQQGDHNDR